MNKAKEIYTPEGKLASEVISTFQKARKNLRIYPSNNPIYAKTAEETYKKTMAFFDHADKMELRIQRNEFIMGDEIVYSGTDKEENLALFFFRDGLRSITIESGLTQEEMLEFLKIIGMDFEQEDTEEDIVTMLWERDFEHILYQVDDSMLVEDEDFQERVEEKAKERPTEESVLQQAYEPPAPGEIVKPLEPMPITEQDRAELAQAIETYDENKFSRLMDILFDMLYSSGNLDEFKDVSRIMSSAASFALTSDNLGETLNILKRIKEMAQKTKNENARNALKDVLAFAESKEMMKTIGTCLDTKEGITEDDFKEFVSVLSRDAIPQLVEMLGELETIQGRKKAIVALTHVGRRDILTMGKSITDSRWFVVRNVVLVITKTKDKRAVEFIAKALKHPDPRVRREAVKGVLELRGIKYQNLIIDLLYDEDESVSMAAAMALGKFRHPLGLEAILLKLADKSSLEGNPAAIRKYFEALANFPYDNISGYLESVLKKNPLIGKAQYNDLKAGAVYCLGLTGNPKALELLMLMKDSKVKQISDNTNIAIKRLERGKP